MRAILQEAQLGGLCVIDEICSKRQSNVARDISGAGVQKALLRMMEGTTMTVGGRKGAWERPVSISTRGMGFIFGGSFVGLDRILSKKNRSSSQLGFAQNWSRDDGPKGCLQDALEEFGMIPEWVNRLTAIIRVPTPTQVSAHGNRRRPKRSHFSVQRSAEGLGAEIRPDAGLPSSRRRVCAGYEDVRPRPEAGHDGADGGHSLQ